MKIFKKNNLKNLILNKYFLTYYYKTIILKTLMRCSIAESNKFFFKLKWSNISRYKQISRQLNVCKLSGTYKKTFNAVGANRHELRKLFNVNKIVHWKKNSW